SIHSPPTPSLSPSTTLFRSRSVNKNRERGAPNVRQKRYTCSTSIGCTPRGKRLPAIWRLPLRALNPLAGLTSLTLAIFRLGGWGAKSAASRGGRNTRVSFGLTLDGVAQTATYNRKDFAFVENRETSPVIDGIRWGDEYVARVGPRAEAPRRGNHHRCAVGGCRVGTGHSAPA